MIACAGQHGAMRSIMLSQPYASTRQHRNCSYADGQVKFCVFDEQLLSGKSYVTSEALPLALRSDTRAPGLKWFDFQWMTLAEFDVHKKWVEHQNPDWWGEPGSGDRLRLVAKPSGTAQDDQADVDRSNNWTAIDVTVTGNNPFDLAAIGGAADGQAGEIVTLDLGLKNLGPATIDQGRSGEATGKAVIELPPGASLSEMPAGCVALKADGTYDFENPRNLAARTIACFPQDYLFRAGTQETFTVKLRVDQAIADATGKVRLLSPYCDTGCEPPDHNQANDIADIVLNGTTGGGLPVTGVQVGLVVGAGGSLVAVGIAAFAFGRRRRIPVD